MIGCSVTPLLNCVYLQISLKFDIINRSIKNKKRLNSNSLFYQYTASLTNMDYIVQNANEIMKLCFGAGFLIFIMFASHAIWTATRLMRKIDDLTDIFIDYIQKPLAIILTLKKIFDKIVQNFMK